MYQRKERNDRIIPDGREAILELFRLLESPDPEQVEGVKNVIYEDLFTAKDSRLLNCIVDYYMTIHSERALDILVRVKEPHDKHLFDKINELMKSDNTCYQSLQLLCCLVHKQPSWIYKIASHRLMNSLFNLLKNDVHAPNLISALFIVVCLLPMIPSQFGPFLSDTFEVFSRLIAWNIKKPSAISESYVLHLQVAVYSLFHRLYGMFPCNFLAYLRSYYGGRDYKEEHFKVFTKFIKPMLERVRLHPLLVTASKETELNANRWKKMEYHDVITDCASVSLDAIEGTLEGLRGRNQNLSTVPRRRGNFFTQSSMQYASLSSQSSITSVEQGGSVNEAASSLRDSVWSPSHTSTSAQSVSNRETSPLVKKDESEAKNFSPQVSVDENVPLDFAVEAKPEELKEEIDDKNFPEKLMRTPSKDSNPEAHLDGESIKMESPAISESLPKKDTESTEQVDPSLEKNILQGIEAKEEDIDIEVSELTSQSKLIEDSTGEERHDTPFCSTTQNLTDEPKNLLSCATSKSESEMLTKSHDEDVDEMYNSMQDTEDDTYVAPFSRYRYLSHCGPPPVIPSDSVKRPKVLRSISCPAKFCPTSQSSSVSDASCVQENVSKTDTAVATCSSSVITTASAFVSISNNVILSTRRNLTYEQLIPLAMDPLPNICRPLNSGLESNYCSFNTLFTNLSPPELLDNYIQVGSVTYANQMSSIPITSTKSTDWTHFGGKPPPDEVDILRNQILLLHNQLVFERHRKDVHSERIRRILGRAKKSKMQEELIVALKEQINLLEKDNEDLKCEHSKIIKIFEEFKFEKNKIETELSNLIKKVKSENSQLMFSNKKLQSLLVTQKEENDKIIADSKLYQERIIDLEAEFDLCKQEVECCRRLKKEGEFLSKQLFLLQEINHIYKEQLDHLKEPSNPNIADDLMKDAAVIEINELKMKLESTCFHLEAAKAKISELEQLISNLKQTLKEQYQTIENIKSFHKDEMKVCEEQLADQKKIAIMKDSCILELHKNKEILSEKISTLERKLNGASNYSKSSCDIPDCHEGGMAHTSGYKHNVQS